MRHFAILGCAVVIAAACENATSPTGTIRPGRGLTAAALAPTATFVAAPDLNAKVLTSTVIEGTAIKLALTNPAPAGASFQYAFDCGSGYGPFTTKNTAACPTVDNEQRTVRGTISDAAGATEYTTVVSVVNQKPHVVLTTAQGATVNLGSPMAVTGNFSDPGVLDAPWSWVVTWGDGASSTGSTTNQSAPIAASHTYASLGTFTIKMTVTDKDGGTGKSNSVSIQVVPAAGGNIWTTVAPLPSPRGVQAAIGDNGLLYALGGNGPLPLAVYDPVANSWTARASASLTRGYFAAGVINHVLYVVGGLGSPGAAGSTEAYDPVANSWTARAPLSVPRQELAGGVVNGRFYAVGGVDQTGTTILGTVEAYDPAANSWTTLAPMPTPRRDLAVAVVNGILYAMGGVDNNGFLVATVEAYDPATNSWTTKPPLPTARYLHSAGVVKNVLYVVGGLGQNNVIVAALDAYDPATNSWTTKAPIPTPRNFLGAGGLNGVLYAAGGVDQNNSLVGTVEAYHP